MIVESEKYDTARPGSQRGRDRSIHVSKSTMHGQGEHEFATEMGKRTMEVPQRAVYIRGDEINATQRGLSL